MNRPGRRGLGFGVGTEPIVAYLASTGSAIVATDLAADASGGAALGRDRSARDGGQELNRDGLCPDEQFRELVTFRPVDMNHVPDDLGDFDFTWSSCALEHLGDLGAGVDFLLRQIDCLRPGGVGVHTTEYNVSSNAATVSKGHTVLYRRRDIEELASEVARRGHSMEVTFGLGDAPEDRHIDRDPWSNTHLKIEAGGYVVTSFGLLVTKASEPLVGWSNARRRLRWIAVDAVDREMEQRDGLPHECPTWRSRAAGRRAWSRRSLPAPRSGRGGRCGDREDLAFVRGHGRRGRARGRRSGGALRSTVAPRAAELAGAADRHPGAVGLQRGAAQARASRTTASSRRSSCTTR